MGVVLFCFYLPEHHPHGQVWDEAVTLGVFLAGQLDRRKERSCSHQVLQQARAAHGWGWQEQQVSPSWPSLQHPTSPLSQVLPKGMSSTCWFLTSHEVRYQPPPQARQTQRCPSYLPLTGASSQEAPSNMELDMEPRQAPIHTVSTSPFPVLR